MIAAIRDPENLADSRLYQLVAQCTPGRRITVRKMQKKVFRRSIGHPFNRVPGNAKSPPHGSPGDIGHSLP